MSYKDFSIPLSKLNSSYDVVIIGAGIGGLVCANFLAKNEYSVLVIEQHYKPGGLCTSFHRKGFVFDAGAHHLGGIGNPRSLTGMIISRLDLDLNMVSTDPFSLIHIGPETIAIPSDGRRYSTLLQDRFPREAKGIAHFFSDIADINKSKAANPNHRLVQKYEMSTYYQMLSDYFTDENLKAILSAHWGYVGLPAKKVSALTMCLTLGSYILDGGYIIEGGAQQLPNRLTENLLRHGGHILLSHEVSDVLVRDGHAWGVGLSRGQIIKARYVVSNIDAKQTFLKLLPAGCLKEGFVTKLLGYKESCSIFMTFLVLKDAAVILKEIRGWHFESYEAILNKEDFLFLLSTSADRSEKVLPRKQSLRISVPIFDHDFNWKGRKEAFEKDLLANLTKKFPALEGKILYQESASPATFYRYTRNSRGAAYGWALTPDQDGRFRLDNQTPIRNLYLTGHWSRPSTGIAPVIHSGFFAATRIMRKS
ncbi:MAG: NAD(P)/FAD-dependent oxidoreductase [Proteobacteria bacterium]|nr:NAD(P)/FAD-dependent oxidoreductase [Pseudomonadota bacterium]